MTTDHTLRLSDEEMRTLAAAVMADGVTWPLPMYDRMARDLRAAVESILAARVQPALDAARAEAWDEGWNASVDSDGFPGDRNPYRRQGGES